MYVCIYIYGCMYVYVFMYLRTYVYIYIYIPIYICIHTHIYECVETVYELPLLPHNTASETFLHQPGALRSVDLIFSNGAPAWR